MIYYKDLGKWMYVPANTGFGNQLFQIAAATSLAIENNDIAIFPPWPFNKYFKEGIKTDNIENFDIKLEYRDPQFRYTKIPYTNGMNLNGYFQSEKYFKNFKKEIRELFTLKEEYDLVIKNKWREILKTNTVSIHVRRGDYIPKESFHYLQKLDYFKESLSYIKELNNIDNVLVFSDDIDWCKENFIDMDTTCVFVENQNEIEDMFLMSLCGHNIITNSSFSWWGSWLNKNENRIVCAPSIWFGETGYKGWDDIYYEKMMII